MKIKCTINGSAAIIEIDDETWWQVTSQTEPTPPGHTFKQAAKILGVGLRTIQTYVADREIEVLEISERKKFITARAIQEFLKVRTRKAIC